MKLLSVFLDSSVILSGLASPMGGSAKLLKGRLKKLNLVTSELVLAEVENHLVKLKISLDRYRELHGGRFIRVVETPPAEVVLRFSSLTLDPNDAHVLAGAALAGADFLISLDKKHILTRKVKKFLSPIKVLSPKQFFRYLDRSKSSV